MFCESRFTIRAGPQLAFVVLSGALLILLGCRDRDVAKSRQPGPLIELERLLAPPSVDAPHISPDGAWLSYLAPVEGAMNFFVLPVENPEASPRQISDRQGRGIQARDVSGNVMYRWTSDSRRIVYPSDREGDENWNLWAIDVEAGTEHRLTDFEGVRVRLLALSDEHPENVLVGINDRDPALADLYEIDLGTAERRLVETNPGFLAWIVDRELRSRVGMALNAETGGFDLFSSSGDSEWAPPVFCWAGRSASPLYLRIATDRAVRFSESQPLFLRQPWARHQRSRELRSGDELDGGGRRGRSRRHRRCAVSP